MDSFLGRSKDNQATPYNSELVFCFFVALYRHTISLGKKVVEHMIIQESTFYWIL